MGAWITRIPKMLISGTLPSLIGVAQVSISWTAPLFQRLQITLRIHLIYSPMLLWFRKIKRKGWLGLTPSVLRQSSHWMEMNTSEMAQLISENGHPRNRLQGSGKLPTSSWVRAFHYCNLSEFNWYTRQKLWFLENLLPRGCQWIWTVTSTNLTLLTGVQLLERTAYYGIALNLVTYLVQELHEGTEESSTTIFNWAGVAWILPLLGGFLADAYTGRFWMIVVSIVIYLLVWISNLLPTMFWRRICNTRRSSWSRFWTWCFQLQPGEWDFRVLFFSRSLCR